MARGTTEGIAVKLQNVPIAVISLNFLSSFWVLLRRHQPANAGDVETQARSLGQEDSLEGETVTHPIIFAWGSLWAEKRGDLHSPSVQFGHSCV